MYNFCFDYYGLDGVYLAFECGADQMRDMLDAMRRLRMRGANVTMPCKQEAARFMDRLSPAAKFAGAVNTIVNDGGVLTGHITDGMGVVSDMRDHGVSVAGKNIVLMGAGGAARAILVQCALDGAKSVSVFNRGEEALAQAADIGEKMRADGVLCRTDFYPGSESDRMHEMIRSADILINATSVGMSPKQEGHSLVTDLRAFHKDLIVYDVVYHPPVTRLMREAAENGCRKENVIGGRGMLLWQGAAAFRLFTGLEMPVRELKQFLAVQGEKKETMLKDVEENITGTKFSDR